MIAETFYDKALANFKTAKLLFVVAKNDEEQINIIGYHLQQALELAIKHILGCNGVTLQKTHDIDQLIRVANNEHVDLFLPDYLADQAETLSSWEMKTRYTLGYVIECKKIEKIISSLDSYFIKLSTVLKY